MCANSNINQISTICFQDDTDQRLSDIVTTFLLEQASESNLIEISLLM